MEENVDDKIDTLLRLLKCLRNFGSIKVVNLLCSDMIEKRFCEIIFERLANANIVTWDRMDARIGCLE